MEDPRSVEEMEERALDLVRKAEEAAVESGRKWAAAIGDMVPVEMPMVHEVVSEALDFTEAVFKLQREFVHDVMMAMRPPAMHGPKAAEPKVAAPKPAAHAPRRVAATRAPAARTTTPKHERQAG